MDSSNLATLGTTKPTIASRRPMLNSQRSLSINTSATHKDFMRKENSVTKYRRLQTPSSVPPVQTSMSPEELSSKIADSFQQFSSMLSQLSSHQPQKTAIPSPISSPLPTSVLPKTTDRKVARSSMATLTTTETTRVFPPQPTKKPTKDTTKEEDELALYATSHAIYHENALNDIDAGNTRLRRRLLAKWFIRAASTNDLTTMKQILEKHPTDLFNEKDENGMTSIMYAAYFGYLDCLSFLLTQPSLKINLQDKRGWTALIWAAHGNQLESVTLLLDSGSDVSITTQCGKTVLDYPILESIKNVLPKVSSSPAPPATPTPVARKPTLPYDVDFYYRTSIDGYNHYQHKPVVPHRRSMNDMQHMVVRPDLTQLIKPAPESKEEDEKSDMSDEEVQQWADSIKSLTTFSWNQCLSDQMFVFSESDLHTILDHALYVPDVKVLMNKSQLNMECWQPANVVFLGARFAHYYSARHLLFSLLNTAAAKLSRIIKAASRDVHMLAYWIANMCQLSSYLKKDPGLFVSTADTQAKLSELISEAYSYFIIESQKKLEKDLDACIMDFESFQEQIDFADDWQRFFRRSSYQNPQGKGIEETRKNSLDFNHRPTSIENQAPQAITHLLSDMQRILQAYHVPAAIVIQAMAQFFHYLSCEIFNRVLTFKKYLCRSKALQVRMNVSVLEEWVRSSKLPASLNQSLEPLVQLLQLLQCLSQLEDVVLFSSTVQTFDQLNPLQVKRCVQNYRYEISETKLPEQVEKLANQWAIEYNENRKSLDQRSESSIDEQELEKKRPDSICDLDSLLTSSANKKRLSTEAIKTPDSIKSMEEKRNSKYLLPFSIMNTTALLDDWTDEQIKAIKTNTNIKLYSDTIYKEIKFKKQEQFNVLDKIFPEISQEWLYNLDKKLYT